MQQSTAYNLADFAQREPRYRPQLRVAPQKKRRRGLSRYSRKAINIIALSTLFLTLVCGVLYLQTTVTELSAKIVSQQEELVNLKSDYTYLSNELEMKTSLKSVAEYASTRLGLVKLDQSQIVYVYRDAGSTIERKKSLFDRLFGSASETTATFSEYLSPEQ